jgi:V/A-type H+-transporting ATPase subunit I
MVGAFVHPLRLTFVEFMGNLDFAWGGKPYRPLAKTR